MRWTDRGVVVVLCTSVECYMVRKAVEYQGPCTVPDGMVLACSDGDGMASDGSDRMELNSLPVSIPSPPDFQ